MLTALLLSAATRRFVVVSNCRRGLTHRAQTQRKRPELAAMIRLVAGGHLHSADLKDASVPGCGLPARAGKAASPIPVAIRAAPPPR